MQMRNSARPSSIRRCGRRCAPAARPASVETAAGPLPGVEIRLTGAAGVLAYTFAVESPHRLLRFERSDGTVYRMAKCERIPYWAQHNPGDESWWPARPAS